MVLMRRLIYGVLVSCILVSCASSGSVLARRSVVREVYGRSDSVSTHDIALFSSDSSTFNISDAVLWGNYLQYNGEIRRSLYWYRRADSLFRDELKGASKLKIVYLMRIGVVADAASLYPEMAYSCVQIDDSLCLEKTKDLISTFPLIVDDERVMPAFFELEARTVIAIGLGKHSDSTGIRSLLNRLWTYDSTEVRRIALRRVVKSVWEQKSESAVRCNDDYACLKIQLLGLMGRESVTACEDVRGVLAKLPSLAAKAASVRKYRVGSEKKCGLE